MYEKNWCLCPLAVKQGGIFCLSSSKKTMKALDFSKKKRTFAIKKQRYEYEKNQNAIFGKSQNTTFGKNHHCHHLGCSFRQFLQ